MLVMVCVEADELLVDCAGRVDATGAEVALGVCAVETGLDAVEWGGFLVLVTVCLESGDVSFVAVVDEVRCRRGC